MHDLHDLAHVSGVGYVYYCVQILPDIASRQIQDREHLDRDLSVVRKKIARCIVAVNVVVTLFVPFSPAHEHNLDLFLFLE